MKGSRTENTVVSAKEGSYNEIPFFSIVMPCYNRAAFLNTAITSVLNQKHENWELIIVDDGSIDNTKEVVSVFTDTRIRYVYQKNQERSISRNNGIDLSRGTYVCFLDSDDYYLDNHLSALYGSIQQNSFPVAFFYTGALEKTEETLVKRAIYTDKSEHPVKFVFNKFLLLNSVCIHKDILKKHRFIKDQTILEDINLWIRILCEYPFFQVPEFTTVCVKHDDQSAKRFFKDADLKIIESYINNFNHIFENSDAHKYIPEKERINFIKNRYITACYTAAWSSQYRSFLYLLKKLVLISPGFIFENRFYSLLKEVTARGVKDLKPGKNKILL